MDYNSHKKSFEIDIKEFLWKFASQWKAIVIVSIFLALVLGGVKYLNDTKAYKAQFNRNETELRTTEEEILKSLSAEEREEVIYIVNKREWIKEQKDYLQESILMNMNQTQQRKLWIIYSIDTEDKDDISKLSKTYATLFDSDAVAEQIKPYIDPKAKNIHITELFSLPDVSKMTEKESTLKITMTLPENVDAEIIEKKLDEIIAEKTKNLQSISPHRIIKMNSEVAHLYNQNGANLQINTMHNIYNLENELKVEEAALNENQISKVKAIMEMKTADTNTSKEDSEEELLSKAETAPPSISIKYIFLGLALGGVVYLFVYFAILVIGGYVVSPIGVEYITKKRVFGEIYYSKSRKGLFNLFHSTLIDKYHYRGKLDISAQINRIGESIDAICEHNRAKQLTVLNACNATEIVKNLKETISAKGIDISVVEVGEGFDEKNLLKVENAVLIIGADTKISVITHLLSLCSDYESNVFGSVYLSAY